MNSFDLFCNFTDECLHGDLNKLRTFDFSTLTSKEFGNGKSYSDGDCTKAAYAIYWLLWKDNNIPLFSETNFEQVFNSYSGDTINTFNTLFGKTEKDRNKVLSIFSEDEQKLILNFKILYQTIGNFYILPKNTIFFRNSLNKYRGTDKKYLDYFDLFVSNLNEYFEHPADCDPLLKTLVEKNSFFFDNCQNINHFLSYFDLGDYTDFVLGQNHFAHWMLSESTIEEYRKFAINYVKKASNKIENRTERIIEKLKVISNNK